MAFQCALFHPLPDPLYFARMRVDEGLSRPFEIDLVAHSPSPDLSGKDLLGKPLTIRVTFTKDAQGDASAQSDDSTADRWFNGYVTRFSLGPTEGRFYSYRLTLRPWLWFLTRQSDCMVFQAKKVPDILKAVFDREPTKAVDDSADLSGSHELWDYCVQYRETDFAFVSRLMEQEGIYYFFEHTDKDHKLVLVDSKGSHKAVEGNASVPFVASSVGAARLPDHVATWDSSEQIEAGQYALNEYDYLKPNVKLAAVRVAELPPGHARGASEMFDYPGGYGSMKGGESYASQRIEELATQALQFTGTGTVRQFQSGRKFTLEKHPRKDQNVEYLITATRYEFVDPHRESGDTQGSSYSCTFTAIPAKQQFRPPRITPKPVVQGVQTAFVTGPRGEEIHTDEYGRVKVQFHWDRLGKNDAESSCWLRVASIAAGPRFGFVAIPRVGHEVVVSFLEGDPDRPLITGVVYNGLAKPPWELPANKNYSGFLTRSTKGGGTDEANEIRFDDTKGEEKLRIHAQYDYEMRTEHDQADWVGGKSERYVKLDHIEKVDGERHRTVTKDEVVRIDGARHLTVQGDDAEEINGGLSLKIGTDAQLKAGTRFAVDAGTEVYLKAGSTLTLEAAVSLTLKVGGNFVNINQGGVFVKGTMVMINSGGAADNGGPLQLKEPKNPKKPGEPPKPERPEFDERRPQEYTPRAVALKAAAQAGTPFCAICEC